MKHVHIDTFNATKDELIAEIERLDGVVGKWSDGWKDIVVANTSVWQDFVTETNIRLALIRRIAMKASSTSWRDGMTVDQAEGMNQIGDELMTALDLPFAALMENVDRHG